MASSIGYFTILLILLLTPASLTLFVTYWYRRNQRRTVRELEEPGPKLSSKNPSVDAVVEMTPLPPAHTCFHVRSVPQTALPSSIEWESPPTTGWSAISLQGTHSEFHGR